MTSLDRSNKKIPPWITSAINNGKVSHAYIIEGDELSNKADFAVSFAKALLCTDAPGVGCDKCRSCRMISEGTYRDIYQIAGDERSVKDKDVELIQERLARMPIERSVDMGGRNIAIVDNADTMTSRAQNRILKTLEEPYPGTVIMLLSENGDMLLPTIRSRCQVIRLYDFDNSEAAMGDDEKSEYMEDAKALIDNARYRKYFFESKDILEKYVNNRASAMAILDALERRFREIMRDAAFGKSGGASFDLDFCTRGIEAVETARKDLKYNVREKYALSNLVLKIGG